MSCLLSPGSFFLAYFLLTSSRMAFSDIVEGILSLTGTGRINLRFTYESSTLTFGSSVTMEAFWEAQFLTAL